MKREVSISIFAFFILIVALFAIYFLNLGPTGFAVLSQYTNESACVAAGYTWQNITGQNCTTTSNCTNVTIQCEPCLNYEYINGTNGTNGTQGSCLNWSSCITTNCTNVTTCVNVTIGGKCVGDVCDSDHLNLCLTSRACETVDGYWYDNSCNAEEEPSCSNDLDLCLNEDDCVDIGDGYWYDGVCNSEEEPQEEPLEEPPLEVPIEEVIPEPEVIEITQISLSDVPGQEIIQGNSKELTLSVHNTGTMPVSGCKLEFTGDSTSLVSTNEDAKDLTAGQTISYTFLSKIPEDMSFGAHSVGLSVTCAQTKATTEFSITVLQKKLDFNITSVQRTRQDRVRVDYSLKELAGEQQDVQLFFSIKNVSDLEVANISKNETIDANKTGNFRINIPINKTLEGNLTLLVNFNSQDYSSSVLEPISLGAPIGGFAIFEGVGGTGSVIILVVVVLVIGGVFFIARRMRKSAK